MPLRLTPARRMYLDRAFTTGALVGLSVLIASTLRAGPVPVFPPGLAARYRAPSTSRLNASEDRVAELFTGQAVTGSQLDALTTRIASLEQQRLDARIAVAEATVASLQNVERTQYGLFATVLAQLGLTGWSLRRRSTSHAAHGLIDNLGNRV
jgi:multidrug resistance efflux pump